MSHPGTPLDYLTNSECIKSRSIWVIIVEFMVILTKWALFLLIKEQVNVQGYIRVVILL